MENQEFSPLQSLDCLSRVFPVKGAVVVGAGMGKGAWFDLFQTQGIENVVLLEAEPSNIQYLQKKYASRSQWRILENVVGGQDGECAFYRLSNSAESSLLEPDVLQTLWPNISVREEGVCQSVTLDWLAHEKILNGNWLVIDVLLALSILNGALKTLSAFDVIIVRQFIDEHLSDGFQRDIGVLMQQHGFCCFGIEQELHPSLGHAVYVKDIRGLTLDLQQIQEQSEKLQKDWLDRQRAWEHEEAELLKENENVEQQLAANNRQVAELTENLQKAQQEVVESEKECLELADKLKEEVQQKEMLRQEEKADWAQEKSELLKEREMAEQKAVAQEQRIKELTQSLTDARQELTESKKEQLDAAAEEADALQQQIAALETELQTAGRDLDEASRIHKQAVENASLERVRLEEKNLMLQGLIDKYEKSGSLAEHTVSYLVEFKKWFLQITENQNEEKNLLEQLLVQLSDNGNNSQSAALARARNSIEKVLKAEIIKGVKNIEAFWSVERYLENGVSPTLSTALTSWPVSPDLALLLIDLIETNDYDLVIEFGSGISTLIIAKTLAKRSGETFSAKIISFDHLQDYFGQTATMLKKAGLEQAVQLELAPLSPYTAPDENVYSYYNCRDTLKALGSQLKASRILVVVDGPPAATGKHARYPALQHILAYFGKARIDLLLDDYIRQDEKEIVQLWKKQIEAMTREYTLTEFAFEKGACLIQIN